MDGRPTPASPESLLAHVEWVRRLARALVRPDEADDVVQQTYAQALVAPPPSRNLRGWLGAIARNVVRRGARDAATRTHHETRAPSPGRSPDPVESVARAELHRRVVEAVLALDEPYRSTLVMRFFDDQPADAIARAVGVPVETVRTRVKVGLARLRTRLEKEVGGDDAAGVAARALWFEQLRQFAGDGTKGSVVGGATAAATATGVVVMTMRASWIGSSVAAVLLISAATWWIHARRAGDRDVGANARAGALAPLAQPTQLAAAPQAATRVAEAPAATPQTSENRGVASASVAMKPFVGGNRGVVHGRVKDAKGEPVAGVEVKAARDMGRGWFAQIGIFAEESWRRSKAATPRPLPAGVVVTQSDGAGRFEFAALSTIPAWSIAAFDPDLGAALGDAFHFDQDSPTHEVELTLTAGAVVHGHVQDESDRPIAGAAIQFGVGRDTGSSWTGFNTNSDGAWTSGYVCGEKVAVGVEAPGFVAAPLQWTPLATAKRELVLDVVLRSNGDQLVSGPIVDATGAAVDLRRALDATLGPEDEEMRYTPPLFARIAMGAVGSEDPKPLAGGRVGEPRVVGRVDVATGRYELMLPAQFHGFLFLAAHGTYLGSAAIEETAHPPPLPFEAKLIPPRRVSTRLVVRVVDAKTKEPIDLGLGDVAASAPLNTMFSPIATRDRAPGVTEFVITAGRIAIRTDLAGYAPTATEIVVAPEEHRRELTIPLDRATAGLRGRALRGDGSAIQQSGVRLFRVTQDGIVEVNGSSSGTNAYGEFELLGLAAAEHIVVVTAPDEACAVARVRAADPPTEFELHAVPGTRTEFHLRSAQARQGTGQMYRIVDEDGIPLVNMFGGWGTSSGGSDTFDAILRPGSYRILVWRDGCKEASHEFDVPSDDPIEVELEAAR